MSGTHLFACKEPEKNSFLIVKGFRQKSIFLLRLQLFLSGIKLKNFLSSQSHTTDLLNPLVSLATLAFSSRHSEMHIPIWKPLWKSIQKYAASAFILTSDRCWHSGWNNFHFSGFLHNSKPCNFLSLSLKQSFCYLLSNNHILIQNLNWAGKSS